MKHKHWLIIYDICDPKRLRNVAKTIEGYAIRVQQSVFESDMRYLHIKNLKFRLNRIIEGNDFIAIIPICEKDWQKKENYGIKNEDNTLNQSFFII